MSVYEFFGVFILLIITGYNGSSAFSLAFCRKLIGIQFLPEYRDLTNSIEETQLIYLKELKELLD